MSYVPVVVPPPAPSRQTRELADLLGRVIVEYEKAHPSVSRSEVQDAARIALQATRRGGAVSGQIVAVALGIAALVFGVIAYAIANGSVDLSSAGPFPLIALIAFLGVVLPLIAVLNRNRL